MKEKVLLFGTGVFLRAFAGDFISGAAEKGLFDVKTGKNRQIIY